MIEYDKRTCHYADADKGCTYFDCDDCKYFYKDKEKNMRLEKAKVIIKINYKDANCGIFNTRNIVGDYMETIYCDDELQIDICRGWAYFEVFGLTDEEFEELEEFYNELRRE